ncbi:MAG: hypothetical protein E7347_06920 [Clostridiales bacterium]|nr:hypothetical protein [Clostridiales bacterium]
MFVTKNQLFIFIACLSFGGVSGVIYTLSALIKKPIRNKFLRFLPDILFSFPFGVLFVVYSYSLNFPNVRPYMLFGVFLGLLLYFKSFHIILAKCGKKIYNIYKLAKGKAKYDRRKSKKIDSRRNCGRSVARGDFARGDDLSNDSHFRLQKTNRSL